MPTSVFVINAIEWTSSASDAFSPFLFLNSMTTLHALLGNIERNDRELEDDEGPDEGPRHALALKIENVCERLSIRM